MKNELVLKELSTAELKEKLDNERNMYQKMQLTHAVSPLENPNNINNKTTYEMFTTSLKNFKGEEIRNKLKRKIENNQKFTEQDIMDFVLTPLMKIEENIVEFIRENVNLVKKIKASQEDILFMESMLLMEIDNFVQDKKLNKRIKRRYSHEKRISFKRAFDC